MSANSGGYRPRWLCPDCRARIWQSPDAALALWQCLQDGAPVRDDRVLMRARWHIALDAVAALQQHDRVEATCCLLTLLTELVPHPIADDGVLLRLHRQLCERMVACAARPPRALSGWLDLLEQRLLGVAPWRLQSPGSCALS